MERNPRRLRLLFLDAYDSFADNIIAILGHSFATSVTCIRIDDARFWNSVTYCARPAFFALLKEFDAVVAGPGPGTALDPQDVGLIGELWTLSPEFQLPVLGICLGFQSLALAFGATIERLTEPRHGIITEVLHRQTCLFKDIDEIQATQYHSLQVNLQHPIQTQRKVSHPSELWSPSQACPLLEPLAWDFDPKNGAVLMGVRHTSLPFQAVQYHPESICTNVEGAKIVKNWLDDVWAWTSRDEQPGTVARTSEPSRHDAEPFNLLDISGGLPPVTKPPSAAEAVLMPSVAIEEERQKPIKEVGSKPVNDDVCTSPLRQPGSPGAAKSSSRHHKKTSWDAVKVMAELLPPGGDGSLLRLSRMLRIIDKSAAPNETKLLSLMSAYLNMENQPDLLRKVQWDQFKKGELRVESICNLLGVPAGEAIVLESGVHPKTSDEKDATGQFSVVGLFIPERTLRVHYYVEHQLLELRSGIDKVVFSMLTSDVWSVLKKIVERLRAYGGPSEVPFWGGLMGFVSYEAGLETIAIPPSVSKNASSRPDICFALITRSVVIDHDANTVCLQTIECDDEDWLMRTKRRLLGPFAGISTMSRLAETAWKPVIPQSVRDKMHTQDIDRWAEENTPYSRDMIFLHAKAHFLKQVQTDYPSSTSYCCKVQECQEAIRAGNSYELCLTDQTIISLPVSPPEISLSWILYRDLVMMNPAPFNAYLRIGQDGHGVHILSSSPERFLSVSRDGRCQYRPIKGTVKKTPGLTRQDAEAILSSSKERAENLMIVDLIRHDLHGVVGAGNVEVTKLMSVEEYETVYQLVSVIEGNLKASKEPKTGVDLLAASLPPGSMTGAPKKRSCQILQDIETETGRRGIYSGVIGYLDVGGGADFSVAIRTAYKYEDEVRRVRRSDGSTRDYDTWRVGAGGAVTSQSTPEGEYEEMSAKQDAVVRVFMQCIIEK